MLQNEDQQASGFANFDDPSPETQDALARQAGTSMERAQRLMKLGRLSEAINDLQNATDAAINSQDPVLMATAFTHLGNASIAAENWETAAEVFMDLEAMANIGEHHEIADEALQWLTRAIHQNDDQPAALENAKRRHAKAVAHQLQDRIEGATLQLAQHRIGSAEEDLVQPALETLLGLARARSDPKVEVEVLLVWGLLHKRRSDPSSAAEVLTRAIALARDHHQDFVSALVQSLTSIDEGNLGLVSPLG